MISLFLENVFNKFWKSAMCEFISEISSKEITNSYILLILLGKIQTVNYDKAG